MKSVDIALLAHVAKNMIDDDHNISEICEELRKRIYMDHGTDDIPAEHVERDTCHILKVAFSMKSKEMADSENDWQKEITARI